YLIEQAPVRLDPKHPLPGTHRDEQGQAYFELATDDLNHVREVLEHAGHFPYAAITEPQSPPGDSCANCGNVAGAILPAVCPNCGFEVCPPCPVCGIVNPRQSYDKVPGSLFLCPTPLDELRHRVRLTFHEPMFNADGSYRQPLVVVREVTPR